ERRASPAKHARRSKRNWPTSAAPPRRIWPPRSLPPRPASRRPRPRPSPMSTRSPPKRPRPWSASSSATFPPTASAPPSPRSRGKHHGRMVGQQLLRPHLADRLSGDDGVLRRAEDHRQDARRQDRPDRDRYRRSQAPARGSRRPARRI